MWGAQDEVGALNRVTPDVVRRALGSVAQGRVLSLAQVYSAQMPQIGFHGPFFSSTFRTYRGTQRLFSGFRNDLGSLICRYELSDHTGTHVDGLNHASRGDLLYNGVRASEILTDAGTTRLGIETMPPVVTRGVLLDVARLHRTKVLDPSYEITPRDVTRVLKEHRLEVRPGDAVLFRTGRGSLWGVDNPRYLSPNPGPGPEVAQWLADERVGITGADTSSYDVEPPNPKELFPCHQILIQRHGIHLVENLDLEKLAKERPREFLFICAPLRLQGGAGSPVAPIAVI